MNLHIYFVWSLYTMVGQCACLLLLYCVTRLMVFVGDFILIASKARAALLARVKQICCALHLHIHMRHQFKRDGGDRWLIYQILYCGSSGCAHTRIHIVGWNVCNKFDYGSWFLFWLVQIVNLSNCFSLKRRAYGAACHLETVYFFSAVLIKM